MIVGAHVIVDVHVNVIAHVIVAVNVDVDVDVDVDGPFPHFAAFFRGLRTARTRPLPPPPA